MGPSWGDGELLERVLVAALEHAVKDQRWHDVVELGQALDAHRKAQAPAVVRLDEARAKRGGKL